VEDPNAPVACLIEDSGGSIQQFRPATVARDDAILIIHTEQRGSTNVHAVQLIVSA
jgi:hypothetical protein